MWWPMPLTMVPVTVPPPLPLAVPVADDNCSVASVVAQVNGTEIDPDTYAFGIGTTTVTWTVRDASGNTASCQQTVTVEVYLDNLVAMAKDITVQLEANGQATISPDMVDNGSNYGCNNTPELSLDMDTFDCDDVGAPVTVVLTAAQGGETATATATGDRGRVFGQPCGHGKGHHGAVGGQRAGHHLARYGGQWFHLWL